ncbi:MAG: ABC transporter permease [Anaerolineales bacterium]|nr:ABC transporter permease [Anaerolineales bacterium]
MRNVWTIARREYKHYFISPIAYLVALMIFLTVGILFVLNFSQAAYQSMFYGSPPPDTRIIVGPMAFLFLLASPALTMRLIADEQRMGTLELLLTAPVQDWELVVGKWLGAFLFLLSLIALTLIYPILLNRFVNPGIDQGMVIAGYLGVILVAATFLSIGTAISSFFSNQFAAFFATLGVYVLLWWMIGWPAQVLPTGGDVFRFLDMSAHFYDTMTNGIIALADIVYYLSLTALGLFLGTVAVELRRWR